MVPASVVRGGYRQPQSAANIGVVFSNALAWKGSRIKDRTQTVAALCGRHLNRLIATGSAQCFHALSDNNVC